MEKALYEQPHIVMEPVLCVIHFAQCMHFLIGLEIVGLGHFKDKVDDLMSRGEVHESQHHSGKDAAPIHLKQTTPEGSTNPEPGDAAMDGAAAAADSSETSASSGGSHNEQEETLIPVAVKVIIETFFFFFLVWTVHGPSKSLFCILCKHRLPPPPRPVSHWPTELYFLYQVLHPGIYHSFSRDLAILRVLARFMEVLVPSLRWLSLREAVEEFADLMTQQVTVVSFFAPWITPEFSANAQSCLGDIVMLSAVLTVYRLTSDLKQSVWRNSMTTLNVLPVFASRSLCVLTASETFLLKPMRSEYIAICVRFSM